MRLRSALALGVTTAALLLAPAAPPAEAAPATEAAPAADQRPTCHTPGRADFPVESRIEGGPETYRPGGGARGLTVELTNTADVSCGNIHPVVVFLDRDRDLRSGQAHLEFQDPDGRWHRAPFHRTDEPGELIGVFDGSRDGFTGFSLAPGRTVAVPVRLGFAADAADNEVVANVAVVQRRDADGDWVGESDDYRFTISGTFDGGVPGRLPSELARTGRSGDALLGLGVTAGALLLGGGVLMVGSRRHRLRRR